jgi:hypothetical protein
LSLARQFIELRRFSSLFLIKKIREKVLEKKKGFENKTVLGKKLVGLTQHIEDI